MHGMNYNYDEREEVIDAAVRISWALAAAVQLASPAWEQVLSRLRNGECRWVYARREPFPVKSARAVKLPQPGRQLRKCLR